MAKKKKNAPTEVRLDALGDPLPEGALARLGTDRLRTSAASLEWSADGTRLATGRWGRVSVWDTETGALLLDAECAGREDDPARVVRLSPDGREVAALLDGQLRVFDEAGKERTPRPAGAFEDAAFSPSGAWLVAEGREPGSPLAVVDAATLRPARELELPGTPAGIAFGPGDVLVAARILDGLVLLLLDPASGREVRRFGPVPGAGRVALAHDGERIVCLVERRLLSWKAGGGAPRALELAPPGGEVIVRALSRDGRTVAIRERAGPLRILDATGGALRRELGAPDRETAALSADGARVALLRSTNGMALVDVATGEPRPRLEGHVELLHALRFSKDGKTLHSAEDGGLRQVLAWDVAKRRVRTARRAQDVVTDIAPDGKTVLVVRKGGSAVAHVRPDAEGGPGETLMEVAGAFRRARFVQDGKQALLLRKESSAVDLVRLRGGKLLRTFDPREKNQVYAAEVSPDGETLATGGWEGVVHLWELASGKELHSIAAHRHGIARLTWSRDGTWMASAGQDKTAVLIRTKDRRARSLKHEKEVFGVDFSPDGRFLATAGVAGVRVWDTARGKELFRAEDRSHVVAFSPDGTLLAAGLRGPILLFGADAWGGA